MGLFDRLRTAFTEVEKILENSDQASVKPSEQPTGAVPTSQPTPAPTLSNDNPPVPMGTNVQPQQNLADLDPETRLAMQRQAEEIYRAEVAKRVKEAASNPNGPASFAGVGALSMTGASGMPSGMASQMSGGMMSGMPGNMGAVPSNFSGVGMPPMLGVLSPTVTAFVDKGMPIDEARMICEKLQIQNRNEYPWRREERKSRYAPGITIEKQVLLDENNIKITARSYETGSKRDDCIHVEIVNATDEVVIVKFGNVIVNGFGVSPFALQGTVAPKRFEEIRMIASMKIFLGVWMLEVEGINAFGQIDMNISVTGMDGSEMEAINKDVTIRTSAYDQMQTEIKDPGKELLVCDGIRVTGKHVGEESAFPTSYFAIWLENISGETKTVNFNRIYYVADSLQTTGYSDMILENGRKALVVFVVKDEQDFNKMEGKLQVAPVGVTDLPEPVVFEIPFRH